MRSTVHSGCELPGLQSAPCPCCKSLSEFEGAPYPGRVLRNFLKTSFLLWLGCAPAVAAGPLPRPSIDLPKAKPGEVRTAVLAAGCFWCVESVFERLKGVREVTSGYAGGTKDTAQYKVVSSGSTQHAESVQIKYDDTITYADLLWVFFATQDPTTKNAQGPDHGPQYRSTVFVRDAEERKVAEAYVAQLQAAKSFPKPIVTTIEPLAEFYAAEDYHQNYVVNHPDNPYVMGVSLPRANAVDTLFPQLLAKPPKR
ncbi:MAG: peptide-methionine (S)-S-oxide reductase MsrA [Deltaproteobacteria bacterium]|nr:peptide-methionine (S)-S-oxide reductase MsrA [Deltaproteobacteria bacterium]